MNRKPTLSVIIATHTPAGIIRVARMNLPEISGVEYVVSWQNHQGAPVPAPLSERADMHIHRYDRSGLSNNRNNAISHATGEICLIADDDLKYTPQNFADVADTFRRHPDTQLALFRYAGRYHSKTYPSESISLASVPRNFNPVSFEFAFRRDITCGEHPLLFPPQFGLGAEYLTAGEEDMFFLMARRRRLNCRFFPLTITVHDDMPTGLRKITDPGVLRANGAVIALTHPLSFAARIPVNAWRIMKSGRASFPQALMHMFSGALHALSKKEIRREAFFTGD